MNVSALADILSSKAKELKEAISETLHHDGSLLAILRQHTRELQPMTVEDLADSCAQTLVCAGFSLRWLNHSAKTAQRSEDLFDSLPPPVKEIVVALCSFGSNIKKLLEETLSIVDTLDVENLFAGCDPVIHFYEPFLQAYDKLTRKYRGVYYTPSEVVYHMVMVVHHQLQTKFGLPLGLADETTWQHLFDTGRVAEVPAGYADKPFVQILDPAMGTGTYVKVVIEVIRDTMRQHWQTNAPSEDPKRLWQKYVTKPNGLLERLYGFEVLLAPWVVAHLRLSFLLSNDETMPLEHSSDCFRLHLTNTLRGQSSRQQVDTIKHKMPLTVIIGNPPYKRGTRGAFPEQNWVQKDLLQPYLRGSSVKGYGVHLKNIYNEYVYFWRFAEWKVHTHSKYGIVSFITASSFLQGLGFYGLREHFKSIGSHLYIIDLEGNQRSLRITDNVFKIQTAVAIGTLVVQPNKGFEGNYYCVKGTAEQKKSFCLSHPTLENIEFLDISKTETFVGQKASVYHSFPKVLDVFPWQLSGVQFQRTWPIASSITVLQKRLEVFFSLHGDEQRSAFKESRDRKIDRTYKSVLDGTPLIPLRSERAQKVLATARNYAYRIFDRSVCLLDARLCTYARRDLWKTMSAEQIYFASIMTGSNTEGPTMIANANVPDLHILKSGGKDILPLYRDCKATLVNVNVALHNKLQECYRMVFPGEFVFYYAYAILGNSGYAKSFTEELLVPGLRVPITKNAEVFKHGVELGKRLIRIHTFAERLPSDDFDLHGKARCISPLSPEAPCYPVNFTHNSAENVILAHLENGEKVTFIGGVSIEVWGFSVSGQKPIQSWLSYRKKRSPSRRSSILDTVRNARWESAFTKEFLRVLHIVEMSLAFAPRLDAFLRQVLDGPMFQAMDFQQPTVEQRKSIS